MWGYWCDMGWWQIWIFDASYGIIRILLDAIGEVLSCGIWKYLRECCPRSIVDPGFCGRIGIEYEREVYPPLPTPTCRLLLVSLYLALILCSLTITSLCSEIMLPLISPSHHHLILTSSGSMHFRSSRQPLVWAYRLSHPISKWTAIWALEPGQQGSVLGTSTV